ncbi:Putative inner membrane protein [Cronobacter malonaticus 507]|nr:Putative inner membrane protein [Cronobacter malonaticus 507]
MLVYWLDIIGTAVFAISGVLLAGKLRMDPFGVLVLGVVTAVGGGTLAIWRSIMARCSG